MEATTRNPILIYDGVCQLCDTFVQFVLKRERVPILTFVASQSESGQKLLRSFDMDNLAENSVLLIKKGKVYSKSRAIFELLPYLSFPWQILVVFKIIPTRLTDLVYDFVARNRYTFFGKRDVCRIPAEHHQKRFLS
jgi:predicted DCC family thiol-disulfide oxidoreductase YuxK